MSKLFQHDTYSSYSYLQKNIFSSLESTNAHWAGGQKRFIDILFTDQPKNLGILDISCGDGVGLREFKKIGFTDVVGVDFNEKKLRIAKKIGYPVTKSDFHDLSKVRRTFDIIYSSHSLEHSMYPDVALKELGKLLQENGLLILVIPYPDVKPESGEAHVARSIIGSDRGDDGNSIIRYFDALGFKLLDKFFDTFREPEIWLAFCKKGSKNHLKYTPILSKLTLPEYTKAFYLNEQYIKG